MNKKIKQFVWQNSPDGGFLQSDAWREFQKSVGNNVFNVKRDFFWANIIEYKLPFVGRYFYIPRGPVIKDDESCDISGGIVEMLELAKKKDIGWIRVEPANDKILQNIKNTVPFDAVKAPHNMQPQQIFLIDISEDEEKILSEMKPKTRYNIRLAKKKGVICEEYKFSDSGFEENFKCFLRLIKETASRKGVKFHSENYYRKMVENIPESNLSLCVATYNGEVIVANLMIFFGEVATYLHGASSDRYGNVMAPFALQWKAILDAKARGCKKYDFGGIKVEYADGKIRPLQTNQAGISRFKLGFSKTKKPFEFPGSYDIILNRKRYFFYKLLQKVRRFF